MMMLFVVKLLTVTTILYYPFQLQGKNNHEHKYTLTIMIYQIKTSVIIAIYCHPHAIILFYL
jgi:hypothetical protein